MVDTEGKRHPTKFVRPVPSDSAPVQPRDRFARRGSAQVQAKRQVVLRTYATNIAKEIRKAGGTLELWRIGTMLKQMGGFDLASREAGLSQKGVVANFLRTFPAKFKLDIPAAGGTASVSLIRRGT